MAAEISYENTLKISPELTERAESKVPFSYRTTAIHCPQIGVRKSKPRDPLSNRQFFASLPEIQGIVMTTKFSREEISEAVRFHGRRLAEMAQYDLCLRNLFFEGLCADKVALSYQRLLKQPTTYQILALIWALSDAEPSGDDLGPGEPSVYMLSKAIAVDGSVDKTINYVNRVATADEYYGLVKIERMQHPNRKVVRGTRRLVELFVTHAARCSDYEMNQVGIESA